MTSLLNKKAVRSYIIHRAPQLRAHKFTQVAGVVFDDLDEHMRKCIDELIKRQPSKGRTIK